MKDKTKEISTNIHKNHRTRMKESFLKNGLEGFSDIEKLEFLLFFSIAQKDTNPLAHHLINEFGNFDQVLEAPFERLKSVKGVGEHTAIFISSLIQVINAYGRCKCTDEINGTNSAKEFAQNLLKGKCTEEFYALALNVSNRVVAIKRLNKGSASEVTVNIRNVTDTAISNQCDRILLIHNHPKGPAYPSDEDVGFTTQILCSCVLNGIELLDHIIASPEGAFSFEESGVLDQVKDKSVIILQYTGKDRTKLKQKPKNYVIGK